jgi:hypothetical protein
MFTWMAEQHTKLVDRLPRVPRLTIEAAKVARSIRASREERHVHDPEAIHENIPQTERSQIVDDDIIFVDPT